jgi:hypothetical protein
MFIAASLFRFLGKEWLDYTNPGPSSRVCVAFPSKLIKADSRLEKWKSNPDYINRCGMTG